MSAITETNQPRLRPAAPDERLIVALDLPNALVAGQLAERLGNTVAFYKIGLGMLTGGGLALANELKQAGKRVFLDMKLYDIGNTVESAVRGLAQFDLDFLTVHGDPQVVRAAVAGRGDAATRILAVTVLTSLDRGDLDEMMIEAGAVPAITIERARRALAAGADGLIASPQEAAAIRALPDAEGRLIVTPGVRPVGAAMGDQKRVASPGAALDAGADHVVVGRPIYGANDPVAAARAIQAEIAARG
ncbi:MAG: orotidine-5'-phosphate decarboxylase [Pseudomonadota bacterium]